MCKFFAFSVVRIINLPFLGGILLHEPTYIAQSSLKSVQYNWPNLIQCDTHHWSRNSFCCNLNILEIIFPFKEFQPCKINDILQVCQARYPPHSAQISSFNGAKERKKVRKCLCNFDLLNNWKWILKTVVVVIIFIEYSPFGEMFHLSSSVFPSRLFLFLSYVELWHIPWALNICKCLYACNLPTNPMPQLEEGLVGGIFLRMRLLFWLFWLNEEKQAKSWCCCWILVEFDSYLWC